MTRGIRNRSLTMWYSMPSVAPRCWRLPATNCSTPNAARPKPSTYSCLSQPNVATSAANARPATSQVIADRRCCAGVRATSCTPPCAAAWPVNAACSAGEYSRVDSTVHSTAPRNDRGAEVEREPDRVGQLAGLGDVARRPEHVGEQPGQHGCDHRAHADEPALHRVAERALPVGQHVADQRAERLHRDVDRGVEDPQHAGRDPQVRAVRHDHQRRGREQRTDQEVRPATPEAAPGAVAEVADDRLHDQAGDRRGEPQDRQLVDRCAERLEDAAHVRVLQREAELDAQEPEAHVPDLPEAQGGLLFLHAGFLVRPG